MKTPYKSIITIVLVGLLVSLLPISFADAGPETSYIIVHALNPEGIEIASIEGMDPYSVQIYDGDTLIGYSAHDNETYNKPIEISPGAHTIKVKFNGMELSQNIDLQKGEVKVLTFTFERTEFDISRWIDSLNIEAERSFKGPSVSYKLITLILNSSYLAVGIGKTPGEGRAYVHVSGNEALQEATAWGSGFAVVGEGGGVAIVRSVDNFTVRLDPAYVSFPLPTEDGFNYWYSQSYKYSWYPSLRLSTEPKGEGETSAIMGGWGNEWQENDYVYHVDKIPSDHSFKYATLYSELIYCKGEDSSFYVKDPPEQEPLEPKMQSGTINVKMSSVPYDLTGTGINLSTISGVVFKDEDGDFIWDESIDIPIKGATVTASLGEFKEETTTDSNGYYSIGVPAGLAYVLEVSLPAGVECYKSEKDAWSNHSTIEGRAENVSPPVEVDIPVTYVPLNYGPKNFLWELWHYGPVFNRDNIVLVHGVQLPIFGGADKIGEPDHHFVDLHDLLQRKKNGQYNVWLFEYADRDTRYTFGHLEDYASRLKEAIDKVNQINNDMWTGEKVSSIIAHSMGGIISRKCLQDNPSLQNIGLLTLATGHFGFELSHWASWWESVRDTMPAGSYLWELNFDYTYGNYLIASIVGTDDGIVKESSARLVQSPDNQNDPVPSYDYYFATIPGRKHDINQIHQDITNKDEPKEQDAVVFDYVKKFLSRQMGQFNQAPQDNWRPYISFCFPRHARWWHEYPKVVIVENGKETNRAYSPAFLTSDLVTKGERGRAIGPNGEMVGGWIWTYNAHPDDEALHIYYGPGEDDYVEVEITAGQSMIVKKLIGEPIVEGTPTVALSMTSITADEGGFVSAGAEGVYTKNTIIIPAGSLSEDTVIYISEPEDNHGLSSAVDFGPSGTVFSEPATVTVEYKDADVPSGYSEKEMRLLIWENNGWQEVPGSTANPEDNTVSGNVTHLSIYAAGVPTLQTAESIVGRVTISPDDDPVEGVQIMPAQGDNKTVTITAIVSDPDGYEDIDTVIANITGPGVVADSPVSLSFVTNISTTTAIYNGTFNMSFYYKNGTYTVNVTAIDKGNLTGSNSTAFEYLTCIGLAIDAPVINFGLINPGENSTVLGDADFTTLNNMTIKNTGNVKLGVQLKGTNMTSGGNMIPVWNIYCDLLDNGYDPLNETFVEYDELNLVPGPNSMHKASFRLHVPWGTPSGNYNGTLAIAAIGD
jgi:hypothetical protein